MDPLTIMALAVFAEQIVFDGIKYIITVRKDMTPADMIATIDEARKTFPEMSMKQ